MSVLTILLGVALMAIGVGTYAGSEEASLGSFMLQMVLGLLALGLGVGSVLKKEMRMHLMHGAILLATMGVLVPVILFVIFLVKLDNKEQMELLRVVLTMLVSGGYVYMAIRSFRKARIDRKNGTRDEPEPAETPAEPTAGD